MCRRHFPPRGGSRLPLSGPSDFHGQKLNTCRLWTAAIRPRSTHQDIVQTREEMWCSTAAGCIHRNSKPGLCLQIVGYTLFKPPDHQFGLPWATYFPGTFPAYFSGYCPGTKRASQLPVCTALGCPTHHSSNMMPAHICGSDPCRSTLPSQCRKCELSKCIQQAVSEPTTSALECVSTTQQ